MKLSEILSQILTDVDLRQRHPTVGVCYLVDALSNFDIDIDRQFDGVKDACKQTHSYNYPVCPENGARSERTSRDRWCEANAKGNMWRGEYGRNRRQFLRDCIRYAKEKGL